MASRLPLLLIISAILLLMDLYLFRALAGLKFKWLKISKKAFPMLWWGYSLLLIIGVFTSIFLNLRLGVRSVLLVAFFVTVISKLVIMIFVIIDDFRRTAIRLSRKTEIPGEKIPRSQFILKSGIALATIPFASLTAGMVSGVYDYQVKRRRLVLPNLPKQFEGFTIAQISDIHSGSFYNKKAVLGGIEMLLAEKPDCVFFTGDLVNNLAPEMRDYQDIFSKVKAPLGVFSTLGNHDYGNYHFGAGPSPAKAQNLKDIMKTHQNMGWDLLMNENRLLKIDGEAISIVGIENWGAGRFPKYGRLDLAVKGTEDIPVKLLLSHDPSHWKAEVLKKYPQIDVMFSGHTHGMQFGVRTDNFQWSPVQFIYEQWAGLYQSNQQQLYVNVGYGFLGYPGRVGILPEITIFELART